MNYNEMENPRAARWPLAAKLFDYMAEAMAEDADWGEDDAAVQFVILTVGNRSPYPYEELNKALEPVFDSEYRGKIIGLAVERNRIKLTQQGYELTPEGQTDFQELQKRRKTDESDVE